MPAISIKSISKSIFFRITLGDAEKKVQLFELFVT